MPTLNLAYIAELAFRYIRKFAYVAFLIPFWLAVAGMWTSAVTAFLYFYHLTNDLLQYVGGSPDASLAKFYGLLNCIGAVDAFNDTFPVFSSGLVFYFSSILFKMTLISYKYYIDSVKTLVN